MRFAVIFLSLVLLGSALNAQGPEETTISVDSDRWILTGPRSVREEYLGRQSLHLANGSYAYIKDVMFEDGVIEVDMAAPKTRSFMGVAFRFESRDDHETVYLRPHKSGLEDAVQYMPVIRGGSTWQLFSGAGFTALADIPKEAWFRVRIEIAGLTGKVFINNSETPLLVISDFKRGYSRGSVGLWGEATGGHFANFRYSRKERGDRTGANRQPPIDPRIITKWELSEAFSVAEKDPEVFPSPAEMKAMRWQPVVAEYPGMIVINRHRRSPEILPPFASDPSTRLAKAKEKRVVFARATIDAERDQVKKLSIGYSDEVVLHLNSRPIFTGKSAFRFRDPGFLGIMDVENDAVYLPLKKGRNELVLAVSEYFGGWGFICRLQD